MFIFQKFPKIYNKYLLNMYAVNDQKSFSKTALQNL